MKINNGLRLAVVFCIGLLATTGCSGGHATTKDQWKAQVEKSFPGFLQMSEYPDKAKFADAMGKPDKTQSVGGDLYWYYRCSDGMIQLKLAVVPGRENVLVLSAINDY